MRNKPSPRRISLRPLLILPVALLTAVVSGLVAWFALNDGRIAVNDVARQLRSEVLARVEGQLEEYLRIPLHVNELNVQALKSGLLRLDDPQNVQRYFYSVVKAYPSLAYSFFGTTQGEFYGARRMPDGALQIVRAGKITGGDSHNFSTNDLGDALELKHVYKNFDPRKRPWYTVGVEAGGPIWTPIYRHFVIKDLALTASQPCYDADGELLGVFGVDYVLNQVHAFLKSILVSKHGQAFILDRSGKLVTASSSSSKDLIREENGAFKHVRAVESGLPLVAAAANYLEKREGGLDGLLSNHFFTFVHAGEPQYLQASIFSAGPGLDWIVAVVAPESDFMSRIDANTRHTVVFILAAILFAVLLGIFMTSRIVAPIEGLSEDAARLAKGNWELRLRPTRIVELGRLTLAFQSMGNQLQSYFKQLKEQNELIEEQNRTLEERVAQRTAQLQDLHNRLRAFFENIPGHINVVDMDFNIIGISRGLMDECGIKEPEEVLGRKCYEAIYNRGSLCSACTLDRSLAEGRALVRYSTAEEDAVRGKSLKIYSAPIYNEHGEMIGGMEYHADISDLRALERELVAAKETAEAANRAKSDFLARMSHEIRTPMNAILGMTQLTLQSNLQKEQREFLEIVLHSANHLLAVINDILDLSKIEARRLTLEKCDFDLHASLQMIIATLTPQAAAKHISLTLDIQEDVPRYLKGDVARLRQVVFNLLGNSLKFTEEGSVRLTVARTQDAGSEHIGLDFRVSDTGIGIPEDKLETVFDTFSQVDDSSTRKYGGTGLGLPICRQLVELMQGKIWVQSALAQGSTFGFNVIFEPGDPENVETELPLGEAAASPAESLHILLAEDTPVNVRLATAALTRQGHHVTVATSGHAVLQELREGYFDIVLMDVEMPQMNGLEATSRIRAGEAGEEHRNVPIVALTAHALSEHKEQCLSVGMDAYVTKPIKFSELHRTMGRCMARSQRPRALPLTPEPPEAPLAASNPYPLEGPVANPVVSTGILPRISSIELQEALERFDGDVGLYFEVLAALATNIPEKTRLLRSSLVAENLSESQFLIHNLKGALGTVGATKLSFLAADIEKSIHVRELTRGRELLSEFESGLMGLLSDLPELFLGLLPMLREQRNSPLQ